MNTSTIAQLTSTEAKAFVQQNISEDPAALALRLKPDGQVPLQQLILQVAARQKAKIKLPTWSSNPDLLFPPLVSVEQASSEETACYKSNLLNSNDVVADLSGGFGIDAWHFSKKCRKVFVVEKDPWLCELMRHNFSVLKANNITVIQSNAEDLPGFSEPVSFYYADPSRRKEGGGRVLGMNEYSPDPTMIVKQANCDCANWMIKAGPMTDLSSGIEALGATEVHLVSKENQVRELLFLKREVLTEVKIYVVELTADYQFVFTREEEHAASSYFTEPEAGHFLYEPFSVLLKANCLKLLGLETCTNALHPNTHLFTSKERKPFPGRTFRINRIEKADPGLAELKGLRATAVSKNFPMRSDAIMKKARLLPDENEYIWFVTTASGKKRMLFCSKLGKFNPSVPF